MIGIDEVGRGCWAGPLLVVAARKTSELPVGLKDSKLLSKKQREKLLVEITKSCTLGEGWVFPAEIDEIGLSGAMKLGVARALAALKATYDEEIIMDGNINYCDVVFTKAKAVIKADNLHPIVSAASIYAKVLRDNEMAEQARIYQGYGFESHVGYGTKSHLQAMQKLGICDLHRKSYKPVYTLLQA